MFRCLFTSALFAAFAGTAIAQTTDVAPLDVPAAVKAEVDCSLSREGAHMQPFNGRILFIFECAGNNQNMMRSLVLAADASGRDARLLRFPVTPYSGGQRATEISNLRVFVVSRTLGEIYVDTEARRGRPCRFETQYRFVPGGIKIVFARQSTTCDAAATRWRVTHDERNNAEKAENWE